MGLRHDQWSVTEADAGRVDRFIKHASGRSWNDIRGLFHWRCVTINDAVVTQLEQPLVAGDRVQLRHDPAQKYHAPPEQRTHASLRIVHEDAHILVVDKPAPLLSIATDRGDQHTLESMVTRHLRHRDPRAAAGIVHRLDREVSGLLVVATSRATARDLQQQFRAHKPLREYTAIVAGKVRDERGTIASRLGTTRSLQRYSVGDEEEGQDATTHYEVRQRLFGATLLKVTLETGRRNQIRVHLSEAGHPVLGDERYSPDEAKHRHWKLRRLALHANRLGFAHPVSGEPLEFESAPPPEFGHFIHNSTLRPPSGR
ncbi:MAG: RluA family pseudouridine synthase [Planctomycetaceae bacterium]